MDMTLAEQLVWAAVFADEWAHRERTRPNAGPVEEQVIDHAKKATRAVRDMRNAFNYARRSDRVTNVLSPEVFDHLRQMTFKAED